MDPIRRIESTVSPLPVDNVDTDQIIPAAYLKVTDKSGLGEGLFAAWREDPTFVLNQPQHRDAGILLAGDNFGCGSSREHAPWALLAHGFRAVISTRFADIFRNNALKNGLLVVTVPQEVAEELFARVAEEPQTRVTIDLERQEVEIEGRDETVPFSIDPFARRCLLEGVDQLGYLLEQLPAIEAWEAERVPRVDTGAGTPP